MREARAEEAGTFLAGPRSSPRSFTRCGGRSEAMYNIFYIIGVIVVVLAVLSLLGLA